MSVNQIAPLLHYDVNDMKHLFVSTAIRIFGAGMIGIFVPLIIYNMGTYPKVGLNLVFVFFALSSLFTLFLDIFVSVPFIHKRGTKISMIIGIIALLVYQNVFIVFEGSQLLRYAAPLFISLFTAFFWPAFHFNIAHTQKTKTFGHQIAKLNIIVTIALALGPLLGGYMLDLWGIVPTVILANIFVVVSIVPLLLSSQPHKDNFLEYTPNISREIISFLYAQRKNILIKAFASKGYTEFVTALWPLLVFMIYKSFSTVGLIVTISTILSVMLIYIAGRLMDKKQESFIMKYIVGTQIFTRIAGFLIVVFNVLNGFVLSFVDVFNRFTKGVSKTCIEKRMYDLSRTKTTNLMHIMMYETSIHGFRVIACLGFILINYFLGVTVAIGAVLFLLILILPWQYGIFKNK